MQQQGLLARWRSLFHHVLSSLCPKPQVTTCMVAFFLCLASHAWAQQVTLAWDPVQAANLGGYRLYYGQSSRTYTGHVNVGLQTTYTLTGLTVGQTYYFTVTAYDTAGGNESLFSNEVSKSITAAAPVAAFTGTPTSGVAPLTVTLTDASTGSITSRTWSFGDATPTSTLQHPSHTYTTPGTYTVSVSVTGPGGSNTMTKTHYITVTPPDTTAPTVAITTPTSSPTYSASSHLLTLGGTATDTVGVTQVTWTNSLGGSGTASGTTNWSVANISLQPGTNVLTVIARDAAGNTGKATLTINYTVAPDTTAPTVPSGLTATAVSSSQINLRWTASTDNVGVARYRVERCKGASCKAFAQVATPTSPSVSNTGLTSNTTYRFRVRAVDAAGNLSAYSSITAATTAHVQIPTPLAAYAFNETSGSTALDATGQGNNGVVSNGALFVAGKNGNGVRVDGVNDFVSLGNPASLRLTGSMTLSAWIYSSAFPVDDAAIISRREASDVGYQLDTTIDTGPRTIALKITDATGTHVGQYGSTVLQAKTWYHVAGVYDATNRTMKVYLNGQLDNGPLIGTIPAAQLDSTRNVHIGQRPGIPGAFNFAGVLDNIRIYQRALSQAEVQADMNTPVP